MADKANDPSTPSLAHVALADDWAMIRSIRAGVAAVKAAGAKYLPKYPAEDDEEYKRRLASTPWRPEFEDAIRSISAKPFGKEVALAGEPSDEIKAIAEDIDGRGNNIHVFARDMFEGGVSLGAHGILVDFPTMNVGATKAEEKAAGARPYWVSVDADEILSLRTTRVGAREVVTHLRLMETQTTISGFEETTSRRIRVIEPRRWEIWKEKPRAATIGPVEWELEDQGIMTLDEVPFVFFATAERRGAQFVRPPLLALAHMQIELYQALANKNQIFTVAGSPMLTANGMSAPTDGSAVVTGPGRVLYAPGGENMSTSWAYIQPAAANMKEIRDDVAQIIEDMRRLGLQPMLPKTGSVTATASGIDSAKAHTAVQSWAMALKDALEQAFVFTAKWMRSTEEVEVSVHTDFAIGMYGAEEVRVLLDARKNGEISQQTFWDEMTRRGVLGPQFDAEQEEERLLLEIPGDDPADEADASLPPPPRTGAAA